MPVSSTPLRQGCCVLQRDGRRLAGRQVCAARVSVVRARRTCFDSAAPMARDRSHSMADAPPSLRFVSLLTGPRNPVPWPVARRWLGAGLATLPRLP